MSRASTLPTVDVAIVNWNTAEAALKASRAFLASEGVEVRVTIADNDSLPAQRELLARECPQGIKLESLEDNVGYGRAANHVLASGDGEFVCVSNADVMPRPNALAALAEVAAELQVGMVGPAFGIDPDPYHSALPTGRQMLGRIVAGSFDRPGIPEPKPGEVVAIGQPSGACFLLRRALWEEVGGFDGNFFLWYEDVDLAKRLHNGGYRNLVAGAARVEHAGAGSFVQIDGRRQQAIRLDSISHYIDKHHSGATAAIARPLIGLARRLRAGGMSGP